MEEKHGKIYLIVDGKNIEGLKDIEFKPVITISKQPNMDEILGKRTFNVQLSTINFFHLGVR